MMTTTDEFNARLKKDYAKDARAFDAGAVPVLA